MTRSWPCETRAALAETANAVTTASTTSSTAVTADQRGKWCRTSDDTAGSIPTARNSDNPMSTRTDPACSNNTMSPTVTATPPAAVIPIRNGERQLNRGPSVPIGA